MYNLKIGVIESIDDVLVNGTSKLDQVGLTETSSIDSITPIFKLYIIYNLLYFVKISIPQ